MHDADWPFKTWRLVGREFLKRGLVRGHFAMVAMAHFSRKMFIKGRVFYINFTIDKKLKSDIYMIALQNFMHFLLIKIKKYIIFSIFFGAKCSTL